MLFKKRYDLIFSLGEACSCTQTLRKNRLQFYSYPFDWLYGSDIVTRAKIIAENYIGFIDIDDLETLHFDNKQKHNLCEVYKNKKNEICFNHDFAYGKSLSETYPAVKEKYDRRAKRLISQIEASNNVLAVYVQTPNNGNMVDNETLKNICSILQKRFPKQNIDILYLYNNHITGKTESEQVDEHIIKLMTDYSAHNEEFPFEINSKVLRKIFCKLKISTKFMTGKNIIKRIFYKLKCFFRGLYLLELRPDFCIGKVRK